MLDGMVLEGVAMDAAEAAARTPATTGAREESGPLSRNLDAEIVRLERGVARAGALLAIVGGALAAYIAVAIARELGVALFSLALVLLGWFLLVRRLLKQGIGVRLFPWVNPLVEVSMPTAISLIDAAVAGGQYALTSSVPLQFYGIFVAVAVLRLKRWWPAVVALVGALQYLLVYAIAIRPTLDAAHAQMPEFRPEMIVFRAVVLVLGGVAASLVSAALRSAVGQAARTTRSEELFGKYRLDEELATGGMGVVLRATYCPEGGFRRPVALKRIHPHLARQEQFVAAFRREAELCARLPHPNIVQVLDFGRIDDTYFLAMEFVDGMTLADLVDRCRVSQTWIPPRVLASIGRDICDALYFAHRVAKDDDGQPLRIVHRDLSPPNVLVSRSGEVKVSDFGIARSLGDSQQLVTRHIAGKAPYLAPEQARGEPLDERCDLFAAGIILWELACLRRLFQRESDHASMWAVVEGDIPKASTLNPDLDERWDRFFERALERDVEKRFQTGAEMREALEQLLFREGVPAPGELKRFLARLADAPLPPPVDDSTRPELLRAAR